MNLGLSGAILPLLLLERGLGGAAAASVARELMLLQPEGQCSLCFLIGC